MITRIKKLELIGLSKDKDKILAMLQKMGSLEITCPPNKGPSGEKRPVSAATLVDIEDAILLLASHAERSIAAEGIIKLKPLVKRAEVDDVISKFDYRAFLEKISRMRGQHDKINHRRDRVAQEIHHLTPWRGLEIPLNEICPSRDCGVITGVIDGRDYSLMREDLDKEKAELFFEILHQDKTSIYCVMLHLKEEFERVEPVLKKHHFNFIALGAHSGTVKERLFELRREAMVLEDQLRDIRTELQHMSKEQFRLMVVYDHLFNIEKRSEADESLGRQEFTFNLAGWVREKSIRPITTAISQKLSATVFFVSEPAPGDDVPIALENPRMVNPFEVVTNLYGQPLYNGIDPTALLAPFFAISFGFCIMDAGYGLILLGLMAFFLSKKAITPAGKKFLKLFQYMALSATFAGIIAGSFFGDLVSRLPEGFAAVQGLQRSLTIFNPAKDSLKFLAFTLAIGFVQIWTGVFIKFLRDVRLDRFTAFILDLPTLCVQTSLLSMVLMFAGALPKFLIPYAGIVLGVSSALIVFYHLVANKEISLKIFWSVFGIYSVITGNFLADTLSFSRIFALGLTGGLLGMAINTMLFPKWPVNSVLSFIAAVCALVFLVGAHLLNLAIGILGAYVHTSRLQYLEFFTKFFESGGRAFRPFREETKYAIVSDEK